MLGVGRAGPGARTTSREGVRGQVLGRAAHLLELLDLGLLEHGKDVGRAALGLLGGRGLAPGPRLPAGLQQCGWGGVLSRAPPRCPVHTPEHSQESRAQGPLPTPRGTGQAGTGVAALLSHPEDSPRVPPPWPSPSSLGGSLVAEGPAASLMSQPYHLQHQIRRGGEDRPKLGSPCLGWGRTGPQIPATFQ